MEFDVIYHTIPFGDWGEDGDGDGDWMGWDGEHGETQDWKTGLMDKILLVIYICGYFIFFFFCFISFFILLCSNKIDYDFFDMIK